MQASPGHSENPKSPARGYGSPRHLCRQVLLSAELRELQVPSGLVAAVQDFPVHFGMSCELLDRALAWTSPSAAVPAPVPDRPPSVPAKPRAELRWTGETATRRGRSRPGSRRGQTRAGGVLDKGGFIVVLKMVTADAELYEVNLTSSGAYDLVKKLASRLWATDGEDRGWSAPSLRGDVGMR